MEITGTVAMVLRRKGTEAFSVSPRATVQESLQLMAEKNIGAVLVLEGERLVGVLSERDWARHVSAHACDPHQTRVSDLLGGQVVCVGPNDEVTDCMRMMTEHRVRHLPVVDGGDLLGVVSIGDLVNWVIFVQDFTIERLEHYIIGVYPD
jgi:CBS domain-containing protein